ncbi:MAG: helix-turn-helix domain-containing protein [Polyangiaceae bacterium]
MRTNAAKILGVSLRSLRYRMQKLEMESTESGSEPPSSGEPTSSS